MMRPWQRAIQTVPSSLLCKPERAKRLRLILARLYASHSPQDMDLAGLDLHGPEGKLKGRQAVSVSGNWRVTFRFNGRHAMYVDHVDYH